MDRAKWERAGAAAGVALAKMATLDFRAPRPDDDNVTKSWTEIMERWDITPDEALAAVMRYYERDQADPLKVGGLIALVREDRKRQAVVIEQAERVEAIEQRGGRVELSGGGLNADGPPVPAAYLVDRVIDFACEVCRAEAGQPCWNPRTGAARKIPCAVRLVVAWRAAGSPKRGAGCHSPICRH